MSHFPLRLFFETRKDMPQPMVKQLQYAAKYFATGNGQQTKAQPLARIATKNDMLRFSSKLPQVH